MAAVFFPMILSTRFQKILHALKINSSDILFHFSLIEVFIEPIFRWDIAFDLFSKTLHIT